MLQNTTHAKCRPIIFLAIMQLVLSGVRRWTRVDKFKGAIIDKGQRDVSGNAWCLAANELHFNPMTQATGYTPDFLGPTIRVPRMLTDHRPDLVKLKNSGVLHYTHFSLALSASRRLAYWVAWNIDGGRLKKLSRKGVRFALDPRIPAKVQMGNDIYVDNHLDRGHIARRADLLWGAATEARQANIDSFTFTNITPQMDNFNQAARNGVWGQLEDALFADTEVENLRVSVFGGPVFHTDDRSYRGALIPREFYKVLAYVVDGALRAKAFLMTQNIKPVAVLELDEFKVYQVTLEEVEQRGGFTFSTLLKAADPFQKTLLTAVKRKPIESLDQIAW